MYFYFFKRFSRELKITKYLKPSSWIEAHLFVPLTEKHVTSFTVILDDYNREPTVVLIRKKNYIWLVYTYIGRLIRSAFWLANNTQGKPYNCRFPGRQLKPHLANSRRPLLIYFFH